MDILGNVSPTPLQQISNPVLDAAGVKLFIKRDDLIHPTISGNKWRKLKYNLAAAREQGHDAILTFGGSFSNHLYATAAACAALGMKSIGIVRGEEFAIHETPTLQFCREQGMELHYVSRDDYRKRFSVSYLYELIRKTGRAFIIPEGGTSVFALQGVAEMVGEVNEQLDQKPDFYAVAAGTGGTAAGILSTGADVLAFSALKGGAFLSQDIDELLHKTAESGQLDLLLEYHFGGYAKWNAELMQFIRDFKNDFGVQLEQVYTAKMFYGLFDLIQKGRFEPGTTIVAVHTGGLQGLVTTEQ